jgi:signal transduction histidine kinase
VSYWTTDLAVVAGLCLGFGFLGAFFGWFRKPHRRVHLEFAAFAVLYAGSILAARSAYIAASAEDYVAAERVAALFAPLAWIALLWFVADYSDFRPRKTLAALTTLFGAFAVVAIFAPDLIVGEAGGVVPLELPWGEEVLRQSSAEAPLTVIASLLQLAALVLLVTATVRLYRRDDKPGAGLLVVSIGWFVATIIGDLVIESGVVDFVLLSDIGFLGFVVAMSIQLARTTIDAERDLLAYQANLLSMVEERSEQLQRAQADLVKQAAERAAADERGRLAWDLHDVVTQTLLSVNLIASSLPRLWEDNPARAERSTQELRRLTRGAMAEMRTLLRELRPHSIIETDLDTLVGQVVDGLAARHDLDGDVRIEMSGGLPPDAGRRLPDRTGGDQQRRQARRRHRRSSRDRHRPRLRHERPGRLVGSG